MEAEMEATALRIKSENDVRLKGLDERESVLKSRETKLIDLQLSLEHAERDLKGSWQQMEARTELETSKLNDRERELKEKETSLKRVGTATAHKSVHLYLSTG